ncbi:unnamed protein product [Closterium sp. NIES-54]
MQTFSITGLYVTFVLALGRLIPHSPHPISLSPNRSWSAGGGNADVQHHGALRHICARLGATHSLSELRPSPQDTLRESALLRKASVFFQALVK